MTTPDEPIQIPIVYIGADDAPIMLANQFVIQYQQSEFLLTMGQIAPPILLGSPEEQQAQAKQVAYVPVKVIGRFTFTRERLAELIDVLQRNLQQFDAQQGR